MSSSRRPSNRLTLLTWWRTSTSMCEPSGRPLSRHPVGASHSSCTSSQGRAEPKLRLACPEAPVQEESALFPANQSEVQEPGGLLGQHGQQIGQRAAGEELLKTCLWLWKRSVPTAMGLSDLGFSTLAEGHSFRRDQDGGGGRR